MKKLGPLVICVLATLDNACGHGTTVYATRSYALVDVSACILERASDEGVVIRHGRSESLEQTMGIQRNHGPCLPSVPIKLVVREEDGRTSVTLKTSWTSEPTPELRQCVKVELETIARKLEHACIPAGGDGG